MDSIFVICNLYLIITAVSCICLGIMWILVKGTYPRSEIFYNTSLLIVVILTVNVLTFIYFYLVETDINPGVPNFFRIVTFILGISIFLVWSKLTTNLLNKKLTRNLYITLVATIILSVSYIIFSTFYMNDRWYVEDPTPRLIFNIIYIAYTVMVALMNIEIFVNTLTDVYGTVIRKYFCVVSVTLAVNDIIRLFVDMNFFATNVDMKNPLQAVDPSVFSNLIVVICTIWFACNVDFSPLYKKTHPEADPKVHTRKTIDDIAVYYNLTVKETEIIKDLYAGLTYQEIAEKHFISINTVKKHSHNSYEKLGISSRNEIPFLLESHNNTKV